ncbi:efflux RND transporter permease subunit [candidate division WOR-3 bacterium]|nr:efflux RND transporter permease subunit [candidate division WOR-3 bacterium]
MKFIKFFTERPVLTAMLYTALAVLGVISLFNLPFELLPDVRKPEYSVVCRYSGASPEIVEREITANIEERAYSVKGIMDIRSVSSEGLSIVTLYFHRDTDMKAALLQLREKMDEAYWSFPEGAERPTIMTTGPSSRPIMGVWIKGERELIEGVISRRLEQVQGVSEARILGIMKKKIKITVEPDLLDAYGITPDEIGAAIVSYNISAPSGLVKDGSYTFPLRFVSTTYDVKSIENIPLKGGLFNLKDVAIIEETEQDRNCAVYYNGEFGYFAEIYRDWNTNSIRVSDRVRGLTKDLEKEYPELEFRISYDDADFIQNSIRDIVLTLLIGGFLAFAVLFLFTGNKRIPLILSVSMPLSIVPAFFVFYIFKISINTMTLAGLALAIGMLVDASIVVLENIIRKGDSVAGAREVAVAVITSVLTTVAVFFPVVYVHGIAGSMLKPLSYSVIITLALSLFVAFTVLPLLSKSMKKDQNTKIYSAIEKRFEAILDKCYEKKALVVIVFAVFLISGLSVFLFIKKEMLPKLGQETLIEYELTPGTDISETEKVGQRFAQYFNTMKIENLFLAGRTDPFGITGENSGAIRVKAWNSPRDLERIFSDYSGLNYSYRDYNPVTADFSALGTITLRGYYEETGESDLVKRMIQGVFPNAVFTYSQKIRTINITLREDLLSLFGHDAEDVVSRLKLFTGGNEILDVERGEENLVISLEARGSLRDLSRFRIGNLPLKLFTKIDTTEIDKAITRFNGKRCVEAILPYDARFRAPSFPFRSELGGEAEEYRKSQTSVVFAFIVAAFLVFLILASFYESFKLPFLIMITVPFAASGFFLSLILTGTSLNAMSLIGLVVLVGIVVNNAIILVDKAEKFRKEGVSYPGKKASVERLRAILMTTLTTVLGLLPFSLGNTLHSPLGRGIIGGLLLSSFVSLLFIPFIYDRVFR